MFRKRIRQNTRNRFEHLATKLFRRKFRPMPKSWTRHHGSGEHFPQSHTDSQTDAENDEYRGHWILAYQVFGLLWSRSDARPRLHSILLSRAHVITLSLL